MTDALPASGFGILDEDDLWMGSHDGPNTFDTEMLARRAMTVVALQFPDKRFRVEPFTSASRMRDEITSDLTYGEARELVAATEFPPLRLVKPTRHEVQGDSET